MPRDTPHLDADIHSSLLQHDQPLNPYELAEYLRPYEDGQEFSYIPPFIPSMYRKRYPSGEEKAQYEQMDYERSILDRRFRENPEAQRSVDWDSHKPRDWVKYNEERPQDPGRGR